MDYPVGPHESERLRALCDSELALNTLPPVLDKMCAEARKHFDVPMVAVTLVEAEQQRFVGCSGLAVSGTPRSVAFCNHTILADSVFVVEDTKTDARFVGNSLVTGAPFIRFYAGAPLIFRREVRFGAFCLLSPEPREFSFGDRAELEVFADQALRCIVSHMLRRP